MKLERKSCGRQVKFAPTEDEVKAGTFEGYGAIFGNVDSYGDVIAKGAFKETIRTWKKERGGLPKMLLQHGGFFGPAEDGIPIGIYTEMSEDDVGLVCKGELFALDTDKGRYIHEGLKSGALDGLSIGYEIVDVTYGKKPDEPRRTLKKINLFEVSVVTFPANSAARVEDAKSIEQFQTLADAESYLRDVAGFSQRQAVAFVSRIKGLRPSDSEGSLNADLGRFNDRIKRLTGVPS